MNNFYLAEPQQMISLTPKKQQKQVAGKTLKKFIDKECNPKKARFPPKIPGNKLQKKHFTKMQKHVGLASTKTNQTRWDSHDNMFSDYHPYIDLSNHTHHNLPCLHIYHPYSITHTTQHAVLQHILLANYIYIYTIHSKLP